MQARKRAARHPFRDGEPGKRIVGLTTRELLALL